MFSMLVNSEVSWGILSENIFRMYIVIYVSHVLFQLAYLENLLKVYNEEIRRLQERELSVEDLEKEDSSYIQEHKLKRKVSLFVLV